MKRTLYVVAVI